MNRTTKKLVRISFFLIIIFAIFISPVIAEGQNLEFGVAAIGNFTIKGEVHSYYFEGNAGDTVLITMTFSGTGAASFELFSPKGVMMNSSSAPSSGYPAKATNTLPSSGRYSISAGSRGPGYGSWGPGPYILTVQRVAFGSPPFDSITGKPTLQLIESVSPTIQIKTTSSTLNPKSSEIWLDSIPLFSIVGIFIIAVGIAGLGISQYIQRKRSLESSTTAIQIPTDSSESLSSVLSEVGVIHHDVFISYATEDKPTADAICNTLESQRIRCWIAPRDILPGMKYQESIIDAIDKSAIMVLVFSSHSNSSPHVLSEVNEAMTKELIIIPFRIEDVLPSKAMKYLISVPHWLDAMSPPIERHIDELVNTIKVILNQKRGQGEEVPSKK